jgi:benzoyl-CoA reductase/2-hydroxyglutaryl-CoA dehydratase subunit BcrC/BadD/HgdB
MTNESANRKPAKEWLRDIADQATEDAWEAKRRGEKVGWCASNFPQEIPTTLGIRVVYPENHGAAIGAKGGGQRLCEYAEAMAIPATFARIRA